MSEFNVFHYLFYALEFDETSDVLEHNGNFCQLACIEHPFDGIIFYVLLINGAVSNTTEHKSRMGKLLKEWRASDREIDKGILTLSYKK